VAFTIEYPTVKTKQYLALLKDFDTLDHFIFDFVPFTSDNETYKSEIKIQKSPSPYDPEAEDQKILKSMAGVSTSFSQISFDKVRQSVFPEKKIGYKITAEYLESLSNLDEMDFDQQFKN
jgi:hypothetical protein